MLFRKRPQAVSNVKGSLDYPNIRGSVKFYQTRRGVIVLAEISGLPMAQEGCMEPIFGFHIHGGARCTGNAEDPFADAGMHYNPEGCPHPYHAGDMPPLFGNNSFAFLAFLTNRFTTKEIIGKTVVIHSSPDDFTSQPAGNAGLKIACGEIKSY